MSSLAWQSVNPDSLRWTKDGKQFLEYVTIGSTIRVEVADPPFEPEGFRIWRARSLLSALFTRFRKPRPLVLQVGGWAKNGAVYSEEFSTGSHGDSKSKSYEFDPFAADPRSRELTVVPHTSIERTRRWRVLSTTEVGLSSDFVPAKAGTKLDLGADGSTTTTYTATAAVDPELDAHVLVPWADGDHDLSNHVVDLLSADAAEVHSVDPEQFRQGAYRFLHALVPDEGAPVARIEVTPESFLIEEGERQLLTVTMQAERPGAGLFALQLIDDEGLASTSDPGLFVVSEDLGSIVLYDAIVKDYDGEAEAGAEPLEAPISPQDLLGQSLPIPGGQIDVEVVLASPEDVPSIAPQLEQGGA